MRERVSVWLRIRDLVGAAMCPWLSAGLMLSVVVLAVAGQAVGDYVRGLTPVVVVVDGQPRQVRTHWATVGEVLDDLAIVLGPQDRLAPDADVALQPRMRIEVVHARPFHVTVDGLTRVVQSHAGSVQEVLAEAGVVLLPGDRVRVDGASWPELDKSQGKSLSVYAASLGGMSRNLEAAAPLPISRIEVLRASHIQVLEGDASTVLHSTAHTVGQALSEADLPLYEGDLVEPGLNVPLADALQIEIRRAKPVQVSVDGRALRTRTQGERVGDVLAEVGVSLLGQDFCDPAPDAPVVDGAQIRVTRVTERTEIEQDELPYETMWVPDDSLELDTRHLDDPGAIGIRRRRYKVVYHDRLPFERVLEEDWLAQPPRTRQIVYGTKVVVRTLDTPYGEIEYWRRVHVFRTAYTAATCGKTPDHPLYGITRLGWPMRQGIVATDPRVIRLRTPLYVPGYGLGIAGDTGGLIIGRHIDLGFEEDSLVWHHEWGYVYLLTPVPPPDEIPYILPDFPMGVYR